MEIYKSRYQPGLINGQDVSFNMGETVVCKTEEGLIEATIDSELMKHDEGDGDGTGYEAIFHDDYERYFIPRVRIVDWIGKC